MFSCEYCKLFKNSFFMEHIWCLLLQVLYKKDVPKNFANSTKMYRYRSPFLSSCRPITCNFVKVKGLLQVFCCKFCEISQNNFMQNFERPLLDVRGVGRNKYSRNQKFIKEVTAKTLRNNCSGKGFDVLSIILAI